MARHVSHAWSGSPWPCPSLDGWQCVPSAASFPCCGGLCGTRSVLLSGPVSGVFADNYRAEVFALVQAATQSRGSLTLHTDSQAVTAWATICRCGRVPDHVAAADLWKVLWDICAARLSGGFSLHLTGSVISGDLPFLERLHAVCNHAADRAAKRTARAALTVPSARLDALFFSAYRRHLWLQRLFTVVARPFRPLLLVLLWMLHALPRRAPPCVSCRAMAVVATPPPSRPLDWLRGETSWTAWLAFLAVAVWIRRSDDCQPGLEVDFILLRRHPGALPCTPGRATTGADQAPPLGFEPHLDIY